MNHVYTEIFCLEISYIKAWFTDQSSKPLETDRINLFLVINDRLYNRLYSTEPRDVKGYGFLSFAKNMGKT